MCVLIDPETGRSKGFGFIQYKNANDAKQALEKMNGFELAGRNVGFFYPSNRGFLLTTLLVKSRSCF